LRKPSSRVIAKQIMDRMFHGVSREKRKTSFLKDLNKVKNDDLSRSLEDSEGYRQHLAYLEQMFREVENDETYLYGVSNDQIDQFSPLAQNKEAFNYYIAVGTAMFKEGKKARDIMREYHISKNELKYLLGVYYNGRGKRERLAKIAKMNFTRVDYLSDELKAIARQLNNIKHQGWLDDKSVTDIVNEIRKHILNSKMAQNYITQYIYKKLTKSFRKSLDPELSFLLIFLDTYMYYRGGERDHLLLSSFLAEQGIVHLSDSSIRKKIQRALADSAKLLYLSQVADLMIPTTTINEVNPIEDMQPLQEDNKSYNDLIEDMITKFPPEERDIRRKYAQYCGEAVEILFKKFSA